MEVRLVASTTQAIVLVTRALQVSDLAKKRDLLPIFVARKTRTVHRITNEAAHHDVLPIL